MTLGWQSLTGLMNGSINLRHKGQLGPLKGTGHCGSILRLWLYVPFHCLSLNTATPDLIVDLDLNLDHASA